MIATTGMTTTSIRLQCAHSMCMTKTCADPSSQPPVQPCRRRSSSSHYRLSFTHASNPRSTCAPSMHSTAGAAAIAALAIVNGSGRGSLLSEDGVDEMGVMGEMDELRNSATCSTLQSSSRQGRSIHRTSMLSNQGSGHHRGASREFPPLKAIRTFHQMTSSRRISDLDDEEGDFDLDEETVNADDLMRFTSNAYYGRCYERLQVLKIAKRRESEIHPNDEIVWDPADWEGDDEICDSSHAPVTCGAMYYEADEDDSIHHSLCDSVHVKARSAPSTLPALSTLSTLSTLTEPAAGALSASFSNFNLNTNMNGNTTNNNRSKNNMNNTSKGYQRSCLPPTKPCRRPNRRSIGQQFKPNRLNSEQTAPTVASSVDYEQEYRHQQQQQYQQHAQTSFSEADGDDDIIDDSTCDYQQQEIVDDSHDHSNTEHDQEHEQQEEEDEVDDDFVDYPLHLQPVSSSHAVIRLLAHNEHNNRHQYDCGEKKVSEDEDAATATDIDDSDDHDVDCFDIADGLDIVREAAQRMQVIQALPRASAKKRQLSDGTTASRATITASNTSSLQANRIQANTSNTALDAVKKTKRQRRVVRFACNVRVRNALSLNDYTPLEMQQCWYQDEDYDAIIRSSYHLIHLYETVSRRSAHTNNNNDDINDSDHDASDPIVSVDIDDNGIHNDDTIRGLEKMTADGLRRRDRRRNKAYGAVLEEQEGQRNEHGHVDAQVLAEVYYAISSKCQKRARKVGKADAASAMEIHNEAENNDDADGDDAAADEPSSSELLLPSSSPEHNGASNDHIDSSPTLPVRTRAPLTLETDINPIPISNPKCFSPVARAA